MSALDYTLVSNVMMISGEGAEDVGYADPPLNLRVDSNPLIGILTRLSSVSPSSSFPTEFYPPSPGRTTHFYRR